MTSPESPERPRIGPNDLLRFALELFAIVSLALWGFTSGHFPRNIVFGIGAPVVAILLWALFRSPRAVVKADAFVRALVEILVMAGAAFAWWGMGEPIVALVFAVVASVSGVINGRREFA